MRIIRYYSLYEIISVVLLLEDVQNSKCQYSLIELIILFSNKVL